MPGFGKLIGVSQKKRVKRKFGADKAVYERKLQVSCRVL